MIYYFFILPQPLEFPLLPYTTLFRSKCLVDHIIEPQRAYLIPHFKDIQETALKNNAIGCSISGAGPSIFAISRSEEHTSELQSRGHLVCRLLLEKKKYDVL